MAQRKIPGNLGHEELRKAYSSGFAPNVKIHLQELLPGGKAGHVFRELTHWSGVTINRIIGNKGRATITLANTDDRHFNNSSQRNFNPDKAAITRNYMTDIHKRFLGYVKEINPNRHGGNTFDFQGMRSFTDADVKNYVEFLYNFDGYDGGRKATKQSGGKPDLPALGLIQRVIIDEQGSDGKWYALFTGIVSTIEDKYVAGDTPMIDIVCLDYWRLFDLSELVIKTGADPIVDSFQFALLGANAQVTPQGSLADLKAKQILALVMDIVQRTMCWIPYALWRELAPLPDGITTSLYDVPDKTYPTPVPDQKSGTTQTITVNKGNFFAEEPFWYIPLDPGGQGALPIPSYEGHDCLRHYVSAPPSITGKSKRMQDGDEPFDGMEVGQLYSTLLIDKYIEDGIQGTPYAFFISAILQPWQTSKAVGSTIIRRVAEATYYDVSITPNGDVLYQIPKYNNCPGEYATKGTLAPNGSAVAASPTSSIPGSIPIPTGSVDSVTGFPIVQAGQLNAGAIANSLQSDSGTPGFPGVPITPTQLLNSPLSSATIGISAATGGKGYDGSSWPDGDFDYAPAPEGFSQKGHGFNYVITDVGNRGWRLSSSEEGLVTAVSVPFGQQLVVFGQQLEASQSTGRTPVDETVDIVARFGLRRFEAQKMTVSNIYGMQNSKDFMDTFAKALLQQINGRAFGGNVELSGRPDLDLGKNIYHVERQKLLYVVGIAHTVRQGQDRSTTLQLAYGHDISREIVSPFVSVRNINSGASANGDLSNSSSGTTGTTSADVNKLEAEVKTATDAVDKAEKDGTSQDIVDELRKILIAKTDAFATAQANMVVTQAPLISGGSSGTSLVGAVLNNPAAGVFDNAANGFVLPSSYTDPVVSGLSSAISKSPNFALTNRTVVPTVPPTIINGKSIGIVNVDPNVLLQEAIVNVRARMNLPDFNMTLEEYTLARFLASEGGGTLEQTIIAQSLKLVGSTTRPGPRGSTGIVALALRSNIKATNGFYGNQAGKHAATSKDPRFKHLLVAQAVLNSGAPHIIPNVLQFFNVKAFKSQPGVTRTAGRVGQDWTSPVSLGSKARVWVGNIQTLGNSTTCFFRKQRTAGPAKDTNESLLLAQKRLLTKTGPVKF